MNYRIGFGFDVHQLKEGLDFWVGGILLPHSKGGLGYSDADVLIHDMQYLDEEMEVKKGWGHSSIGMVSDVVEKSNVKHFILL